MVVETKKLNKQEVNVVSSLDIAETFEKRHDHVLRDIRNLECSEEFHRSNFGEMSYKDSYDREQKAYYITRDGFTLLVMGYTGEKAMKFKEAYIRQFNNMERLLREKCMEREKGIAVRNSLCNALKLSAENERMHGHAYSIYTNCIYKVLFGMNAKQLREHYGIDKPDSLRNIFSAEELAAVQAMENLVSGLVSCGWGYDDVNNFIEHTNTKKLV